MEYALIGCGRVSPNHIVASRNNGLEIVGICDVNEMCLEDKVPERCPVYDHPQTYFERKVDNY